MHSYRGGLFTGNNAAQLVDCVSSFTLIMQSCMAISANALQVLVAQRNRRIVYVIRCQVYLMMDDLSGREQSF